MGTIITTISIPIEQSNFCAERKIKLSKLLQESIQEKMDNEKISADFIKNQERKIAFLSETINKQRDFIEARGLMDSFMEKC